MGDDAGAGIHPTAAAGFSASAEAYERARPGYPQEAVAWLADRLRIGPGRDVLDLAAGTGKLTRALAPLGARLVPVEAFDGTAEAIPLPDGSVDVVTCGQAFHWFHAQAALAEIHRVLRPGGGLALVWNVRDLSNPLQARIQEILAPHRAGAVSHLDIDPPALLAESGLFGPADTRRWLYEQRLSRAHLVDRIASTSFVATLDPDERAGVLSLVLEAAEGHPEPIAIPYVTEAYAADRLEPGA